MYKDQTNIIPKKIHYCRFWWNKKPKSLDRYLYSWKKHCSDYEIIEWNESNFPIDISEYSKKMYDKKKWAFLSDYARFWILYNFWWIYFDTDVEVIKNFDKFLSSSCFIWFQDEFSIGWAVIWCTPKHWFTSKVLEQYNHRKNKIVLPYLLTPILKRIWLKYGTSLIENDIMVYSKEYFYPFAFYENFNSNCVKENTYSIHWYDSTWLPKVITKILFPIVKIFYIIWRKFIKTKIN